MANHNPVDVCNHRPPYVAPLAYMNANVRHQDQTPGTPSGSGASGASHVILKAGWLGFQAHTFLHWFQPCGFSQKAQADHWPKAAILRADQKKIIGRERGRKQVVKQYQHHCCQRKGDCDTPNSQASVLLSLSLI